MLSLQLPPHSLPSPPGPRPLLQLDQLSDEIKEGFKRLDEGLNKIDSRLEKIDSRLTAIEVRRADADLMLSVGAHT